MKLRIHHAKEIKKIHTEWIYIGCNFEILDKLKSKTPTKNICLHNSIREEFSNYKHDYFNWLELQRKYNDDSLEWWMTDIANGNTMVSKFYLFLSQLIALKKYLDNCNSFKEITIVCEDIFLYNFIRANLTEFKLSYSIFGSIFFVITDSTSLLLTGVKNYFIQLKYILSAIYYSYKTRPKYLVKPTGTVALFHQLLQVKGKNRKVVSGNYQKFLPKLFSDKGYNVFQLCMNYDVEKDKTQLFKLLRSKNFFFPDDWLNFNDYIKSFIRSIKTFFVVSHKFKFRNIIVKSLVFRERLYHLQQRPFLYFRYKYALEKWSKDAFKVIYFDNFEGTVYQQVPFHTLNKMNKNNITTGMIHHSVSEEYFAHHSQTLHWDSFVKPRRVLCHSNFYRDILISRNYPSNILSVAPPIRSRFINYESYEKNKNYLLVNLPLDKSAFYELVLSILSINTKIKEMKINVAFRLHPTTNEINLTKLVKNMPDNFYIFKGELYDTLVKTFCCLTMSSASVYDAIQLGASVITLKSEINIMDNYTDFLVNKFPILDSIEKNKLTDRIYEVFFEKEEYYQIEFDKIRNYLKDNSLKLDNKNSEVFFV